MLTYLHKHVAGFGFRFPTDPSEVRKNLGLEKIPFEKSATYLEAHVLIGISAQTNESSRRINDRIELDALFLTGLGEDFMRELEKQDGMPKRMTIAALGFVEKAAVELGTSLLTAYTMLKIIGRA